MIKEAVNDDFAHQLGHNVGNRLTLLGIEN